MQIIVKDIKKRNLKKKKEKYNIYHTIKIDKNTKIK